MNSLDTSALVNALRAIQTELQAIKLALQQIANQIAPPKR